MSIEDPHSAPAQAEPPAVAPPASDRFAVFRNRNFLRYWLARFFGAFAAQVVAVSVGWQIYALTGDARYLGLVGLSQFLPGLVLVLVTGVAADRFPRRLIMGLAAIVEALAVLALFLFTWHGLASPLPVFAILAVIGVARAFFGPASSSLVVNLVPREELGGAIAWNSSSWQLASVLGPVAGGLLYGLGPLIADTSNGPLLHDPGALVAYGTGGLLFALAAVLVFTIRAPAVHTAREPASAEALVAGFRFIWREKIVLGAISLDLFAVLLGGAVALMPVFASDILAVGPWGLGMLRAAPGIGAVLMVVWLTRHPVKDRAGVTMFVFVGLFGLFTVLFGVSTVPWLSILALALLGASDMISVYVRETLMQLWTPDDVRGRVNAVNGMFVGASNELGEFRAGMMAHAIGAVPAVVLGGAATMGVAVLWAWMFPSLRRARRLDGAH